MPLAKAARSAELPLDTPPMEAASSDVIPVEQGTWQYEPKWDGFRCLAFKTSESVELRAKSGKPLGRYFPEILTMLAGLDADRFVLDGELVIEHDGRFSFDALQMRLHPAASRVRDLSVRTPARLILFDILMAPDGAVLRDAPLRRRRAVLESFFATTNAGDGLALSPATSDPAVARRWLDASDEGAFDGVMAKRIDGPYAPGERAMIKTKPRRTADCVVGGFRYQSGGKEAGSLLLGLYDEAGLLNHVGFTATIADRDRAALTKKLEGLREPTGFTGDAPGGPSRWSTARSAEWVPLRPELVVEVHFDQVTAARFRHGTKLLRWRPDKAPLQCTMDQLAARKVRRQKQQAGPTGAPLSPSTYRAARESRTSRIA